MVLILELLGGLAAVVALAVVGFWFFTLPRVELWLGMGDTAYKARSGWTAFPGDPWSNPPPPTGPVKWPDTHSMRTPEIGAQASPRGGYTRGTLS